MSAARPRSRALKAISFIASTVCTTPGSLVTSIGLIVSSCRHFCSSAVVFVFDGVSELTGRGVADDDAVPSDVEHRYVVVAHKAVLDHRQHRRAARQFVDGMERTVFAGDAERGVALLERRGQHVGGRTEGGAGVPPCR